VSARIYNRRYYFAYPPVQVSPTDSYYSTSSMQQSGHRQSQSPVQSHYSYSSSSRRPSGSSYDPSAYPSEDAYYQNQQAQLSRVPRSHYSGIQPAAEQPFIPTPSEMYNNYPPQQISLPSHSPTSAPYNISQYSQHSPRMEQRVARISIGRPQSSPSSTVPPATGERFKCDQCPKTFSRSHDRKRHHETQHQERPVIHRCKYCKKEFSR
jgi:hypothetical protein